METKNCPYCSEEILKEAKKCKFCGEFIDEKLREDRKQEKDNERSKEVLVTQKSSGLMTFLIILVIIILIGIITGV